MRFELTTLTLARLCSTPELRPHSVPVGGEIQTPGGGCKGEMTEGCEILPRYIQPAGSGSGMKMSSYSSPANAPRSYITRLV